MDNNKLNRYDMRNQIHNLKDKEDLGLFIKNILQQYYHMEKTKH